MHAIRSWLYALAVASPVVASAQADSMRPAPVVSRGDLAALAIGAGVSVLAQRADLRVQREVRSPAWQESGALDAVNGIGNPWGAPGVIALGAALWLGGRWSDRPLVAATGLRAVEAIVISGQVTQLLKGTFGRARPRVNPSDAWDVDVGRGFRIDGGDYESMPSGHATAAFAFAGAVTSELLRREHPKARLVGIATFTLAATTAYARMHSDAHWLSDVTMGATIGGVTGWAVTRWHATRPGNALDRILLGADVNGAMVGARFSWR